MGAPPPTFSPRPASTTVKFNSVVLMRALSAVYMAIAVWQGLQLVPRLTCESPHPPRPACTQCLATAALQDDPKRQCVSTPATAGQGNVGLVQEAGLPNGEQSRTRRGANRKKRRPRIMQIVRPICIDEVNDLRNTMGRTAQHI